MVYQKNAAGLVRNQIIIKGMKFILCLFVCLITSKCAIYSKISTLNSVILTSNDYLVSTLGLFRTKLNPKTCQLIFENFVNSDYLIVGYYPRSALSPCSFVTISNNSLVSSNNDTILSLKSSQINNIYDEVFMTIDEMGIVRINGIYIKKQETAQNWIAIFRTPQQFIYSISSLNISIYSSLPFVQNNGNWGFSASNGQLRIFRIDNVSKIIRYKYQGFTLVPNNLFDFNSNSLPNISISGFTYKPTCSISSSPYLFEGPFIFTINPYWPELRLLDSSGYEILSVRYPNYNCFNDAGEDYLLNSDQCLSWFCPLNTFQLNGGCYALCPPPYYHQIEESGINRCLLNCQANYVKDIANRVCRCGSIQAISCPNNLKKTPLTCLCTGNTFYNPYNQVTESNGNYCFRNCGPFLYPHKDGTCVRCPKYCEICTQSWNSFSYLSCTTCQLGYQLNSDGYCLKGCDSTLSPVFNQICLPCFDNHCFNCSLSMNECTSCLKPYSLFNNSCITQCPKGFKSTFNKRGGFICVVISGCSVKSTIVSSINNQSSCYCLKNGNPSFAKGCNIQQQSQCKIDQYYDNNTLECLMCPIGCLTCSLDTNSQVECTSCRPQYILFITLVKNHYCERDSILSICSNNYTSSIKTCSIFNLANIVLKTQSRNKCFQKVPNCSICLSFSPNQCGICMDGFYLFKGTCLNICPANTSLYQFQKVCLPKTLQNCKREVTSNSFWIFYLSFQNVRSDGLYYLTNINFQNVDYLNNPLGTIFYGFNNQQSNQSKIVNIATSYQKCQICLSGYGLDFVGKCQKCPSPCYQCIFTNSKSVSCLSCTSFYSLTSSNTCMKLNSTELPCMANQFRNESRMCQSDCLNFYRQNHVITNNNKNYTINCTINCPDGYQISSYYNSQNKLRLQCLQANSAATSTINFFGNQQKFSSSKFYMLISSEALTYLPGNQINVEVLTNGSPSRFLSQADRNVSVYTSSFGLIIIDNTPSLSDSSIIISMQPTNIYAAGSSNIYLSNSIYGFDQSSEPFINVLLNQTHDLFVYGRAYCIITLLLAIIFMSEKLNYKTDNLFIIYSVTYLILPSLNLKMSKSAFNSYSFLYGFAWSANLQLLSNPRFLTSYSSWFPENYLQYVNNNAHYILFVDNNFLRNVWSIMLVLICAIGLLGLIMLIMRCFSVSKMGYISPQPQNNCFRQCLSQWSKFGFQQIDINHIKSVRYLLLLFIENSLIGICFYSIINILNTSWQLASKSQQLLYKIMSIVFLALAVIYSLGRFYVNRIGGIYCFKRVFLGLVLGLSSIMGGVDQNKKLIIGLLLAIQFIFLILRYRYEFITNYFIEIFNKKPKPFKVDSKKINNRHTISSQPKQQPKDNKIQQQQQKQQFSQAQQFWTMVVEQLLIMSVYVFLAFVNNLTEISILVVWIIINIFMVNFGLEFTDLVFNYWNRAYNTHVHTKSYYHSIRLIWDHNVPKSECTTEIE